RGGATRGPRAGRCCGGGTGGQNQIPRNEPANRGLRRRVSAGRDDHHSRRRRRNRARDSGPAGAVRRDGGGTRHRPGGDRPGLLRRAEHLLLRTGISLRVLSHGGSNAIAIAPWRSADHHALLWGAPQEGFGTPGVGGEEYRPGPGYDAGGVYMTGWPLLLTGRHRHSDWITPVEA